MTQHDSRTITLVAPRAATPLFQPSHRRREQKAQQYRQRQRNQDLAAEIQNAVTTTNMQSPSAASLVPWAVTCEAESLAIGARVSPGGRRDESLATVVAMSAPPAPCNLETMDTSGSGAHIGSVVMQQ